MLFLSLNTINLSKGSKVRFINTIQRKTKLIKFYGEIDRLDFLLMPSLEDVKEGMVYLKNIVPKKTKLC